MSILVSGATGFIALHVVSDLLKQDYKVIGTVRSSEKQINCVRNLVIIPTFPLNWFQTLQLLKLLTESFRNMVRTSK